MTAAASTSRVDGPYATEADAWAADMPRVVQQLRAEAAQTPGPEPVLIGVVLRHLREACTAARVQIGAYDAQVLASLARAHVPAVQAVIGLIVRAYAAGVAYQPAEDAASVEVGAAVFGALADGHDRDQITAQLGVSPERALLAVTAYAARALAVPAPQGAGCTPGEDGWCYAHGRWHAAGEVGE